MSLRTKLFVGVGVWQFIGLNIESCYFVLGKKIIRVQLLSRGGAVV